MSDKQTFNFGNHKTYVPYDGDGAAALLPFDGFVRCVIKRFKETSSKGESPKPMVKITLKVAEEDLPAHTLYAQALTGGVDRNDEDLGRQFANVLVSSGLYTLQTFQAEAARGTSKTIDELLNAIITQKKYVYVEVQADTYQNKTTSKVNNFVTQAVYEREVAGGTHRNYRQAGASGGGAKSSATAQQATGMLQGVI